jgi:hypothetical protein
MLHCGNSRSNSALTVAKMKTAQTADANEVATLGVR